MRPSNFLTSFALFTAVSYAWPASWDPLGTKGAARIRARQNNNNNDDSGDETSSFDLSISTEQGNTATTRDNSSGDSNNSSDDNEDSTSTGRNTNSNNSDEDATSSGDRTGTRTSNGDSEETTRTFDNRLPAGGVQMVTPDPMAGAKYYKIASEASKEYVTFGFNFTSLSVTPSAIDILASCSVNSATYTLASNQSVTQGADGGVQAITWDTGAYQQSASVPLLMGTYTLMIHDAAKDVSATPQAGYLGTWEQFTFGMYEPQPYVPLDEYTCATCSGALSGMQRMTLGFALGTVGVTVVSFSWFAGVAGLW